MIKKILKKGRRYHYLFRSMSSKPAAPFHNAFVIGQNKTGTTSMYQFFQICGMRHLTINEHIKSYYFAGRFDALLRVANRFNTFDDIPWNRLDVIAFFMRQPVDNRFILTCRDPNEWFDSLVRFNRKRGRDVPSENQRSLLQQTELLDHNEACRNLASRFQKPLLEIDVTKESNVNDKVVKFLGLDLDPVPEFPHINRTK